MNIWDIDKAVGLWIESNNRMEFCMAVVSKAQSYGFVTFCPQTPEEWHSEVHEAYDFLNSLCPHGYWFEWINNAVSGNEIRGRGDGKNELWLVSEDE